MWLNDEQVAEAKLCAYRASLLNSRPKHIVIDKLFDESKLDEVMKVLLKPHQWQTQTHTYSDLYVDKETWQKTCDEQRFVQRDVWRLESDAANTGSANIAKDFLSFLRGDTFMSVLSRIFKVPLTDMNVAKPAINTNYFRLGTEDFVRQHADDSPGRQLCMLLYLNKEWNSNAGGELVFLGRGQPIPIAPLYNRCVLFDPSSKGTEHWVEALNSEYKGQYRYNVTSWYWSE